MKLKKNIQLGKVNFLIILICFTLANLLLPIFALENKELLEGDIVEINILDKVSSKNNLLKIKIGEEKKYKNLLMKVLKCKNSKFDDNPDVTAYLQVKDLNNSNNDEVFVFNGWTFSSSPTINTFDHPVYDIWLTKCY